MEKNVKVIMPESIGQLNEKYVFNFIYDTIRKYPSLIKQYVFVESKDELNFNIEFLNKVIIDNLSEKYDHLPEEIILFLFGYVDLELSEEEKGQIIAHTNGLELEWTSQ